MNTDGPVVALAAPVGNYHDNVSPGAGFPFVISSERGPVDSVMSTLLHRNLLVS